jgi:hypothetical protein
MVFNTPESLLEALQGRCSGFLVGNGTHPPRAAHTQAAARSSQVQFAPSEPEIGFPFTFGGPTQFAALQPAALRSASVPPRTRLNSALADGRAYFSAVAGTVKRNWLTAKAADFHSSSLSSFSAHSTSSEGLFGFLRIRSATFRA